MNVLTIKVKRKQGHKMFNEREVDFLLATIKELQEQVRRLEQALKQPALFPHGEPMPDAEGG